MKFSLSTLIVWISFISGIIFFLSIILSVNISISKLISLSNSSDNILKEVYKLKSQIEIESRNLEDLNNNLELKHDSILNLISLISNLEQKETKYIKLYESSIRAINEGINDLLRIRNNIHDKKDRETMEKVIEVLVGRFKYIPGISIILPRAGDQFNPIYHSAIKVYDTTDPSLDGKIKEVFSAGIKIMGKIERRAEVEIYRRSKDEK